MSDANAGPLAKSPGDDQSLAATLRFIQRAIEMEIECCLPCKIVSYDRKSNTAVVQPMIMVSVRSTTSTDLIRNKRVDIPDIPVLSLGAGGFHISFPIKKDDLGWIYACDRDITLFLQALQAQPSGRDGATHKFSDAIFIPDVYRNYTINAEDEGALVIQSVDSSTRISVRSDNIKITAPTLVQIDSPMTEMLHNVKIGGSLEIVESLKVDGPTCTLPTGTTVGGGAVYGHNHHGTVPAFP